MVLKDQGELNARPLEDTGATRPAVRQRHARGEIPHVGIGDGASWCITTR